MGPNNAKSEQEEDDYLTMTFAEPTQTQKTETLTQRKKRLAREAEIKARPKSKAEIAAEERAKRDAALQQSTLDTSSKGFKMMAALGYKPGSALGAAPKPPTDGLEREGRTQNPEQPDHRLLEPIGLEMKEGRSGIGADAEKKRKIREEFEQREEGEKRRKVEAGEFRERQQKEREEKKMEGQVWGAMKVCEKLDDEDDNEDKQSAVNPEEDDAVAPARRKNPSSKPLHSVNVLWRALVRQRALDERDRRMRYDLHQSLSRRPDYDDPEEDREDRQALSRKAETEEVDVDLDQDDDELAEFEALDVAEKLTRLVEYLRSMWHYCFWCKFRYPDEELEGCPGLTEDDHD